MITAAIFVPVKEKRTQTMDNQQLLISLKHI